MSCEIATINRVFIVRWSEPTVEDVKRVLDTLNGAQRAAGRPLIFLAVIPAESAPPPANVRKAMDGALARACADCESVLFIVEGTGFKHTILRTILAANILATGRRGKVFVSSCAEEAIDRAPPEKRMELATALMLAGARGLVTTTNRLTFPKPKPEEPVRRHPTP
jgi:hypothetical protein